MAHTRTRWMYDHIKSLLNFSAIVGVIGQRQTGKTTLISSFAKEYRTLDLKSELLLASQDPQNYLRNRSKPFAIDECQMAPDLFPALKDAVRLSKAPGQFILSGSVRFTSKKQIKESLTGRISTVDLLPFSFSELHGLKCPDLNLQKNVTDYEKSKKILNEKQWQHFLNTGGLPGICFRRNQKLLYQGFEDQLSTLLDRDIRLIIETKLSYQSLLSIIIQVGLQVGSKLNLDEICRATRVSKPTLKKVLFAFEALFLIRFIEKKGGVKTKTVFFEDVGLLNHLVGRDLNQQALELNALYQCIRLPYFCKADERFEIFQFETRGGAYAPLAIKYKGVTTAIILTPYSEPGLSELKSAQSFIKRFAGSNVVIAGKKLKYHRANERITYSPFLGLV